MKLRSGSYAQQHSLDRAHDALRLARDLLRHADCPKVLRRVRAAISSAKGAERHMRARIAR